MTDGDRGTKQIFVEYSVHAMQNIRIKTRYYLQESQTNVYKNYYEYITGADYVLEYLETLHKMVNLWIQTSNTLHGVKER